MEGDTIFEFFHSSMLPELNILHLNACTISKEAEIFEEMFPNQPSMLAIANAEIGFDIVSFAKKWGGQALCVSHCLFFHDGFFHSLATEIPPDDDLDEDEDKDKQFPCPDLSILLIMFSRLWDIKSLKKLIKKRNHYVDYNDPDWKTNMTFGPAIQMLMIRSCSAEELSTEDEKWFKEWLVDFTWMSD